MLPFVLTPASTEFAEPNSVAREGFRRRCHPPAAITGRLQTLDGLPIPNHPVSITTDPLPPASSVFAFTTTDADGRFRFDAVPTTPTPAAKLWFSTRLPTNRRAVLQTNPLPLPTPAPQNFTLTLTPDHLLITPNP